MNFFRGSHRLFLPLVWVFLYFIYLNSTFPAFCQKLHFPVSFFSFFISPDRYFVFEHYQVLHFVRHQVLRFCFNLSFIKYFILYVIRYFLFVSISTLSDTSFCTSWSAFVFLLLLHCECYGFERALLPSGKF